MNYFGQMINEDIDTIETATGIKLPQSYIDAATNYPPELLDTEAPDFGFLNNPQLVIDENLRVRKEGYFGEPWPDQYFIIGQNGCGDYYVVTTSATRFSVGFSDHEAMEMT